MTEAIRADAEFLLERLFEFSNEADLDDHGVRVWVGHVEPAMARLRHALAAAPQATDPRDATDWKARCEAAEAGIHSWEITAKRINEEADKELTAAQAEIEKLRDALGEAIELASQDDYALTPAGEAMIARWVALSPPPLSPEPAHD